METTVLNDDIENKIINNKKFKNVKLLTKNNYILVTNLDEKNHDDDKIKSLYEKRWDIEVYFKTLKSIFKMSNLRITNKK